MSYNDAVSIYSPGVYQDMNSQELVVRQREEDVSRALVALQRRETDISNRESAVALKESRVATQEMMVRSRELQVESREQTVRDREARVRDEESRVAQARADVERQRLHTEEMERQRKSRRTYSEAHIEDTFPALGVADIVKLLAHSSDRLRRYTIDTLEVSLESGSARGQNRIQPGDLAPLLLPTLIPLLVAPRPDVHAFAVKAIQHPKLSLEYARMEQCPHLMELVRSPHDDVRNAAIVSLRKILQSDKITRRSLAASVHPYVKNMEERSRPFVQEALPRITTDFLEDQQYAYILALGFCEHEPFRTAVIPIVFAAIKGPGSQRLRDGLVDANILGWFDNFLGLSPVPVDIRNFFHSALPLLAAPIALKGHDDHILELLGHPEDAISRAAIITLRHIAQGTDDMKFDLVQAGLLSHLRSQLSSLELTPHIVDFACDVIPPFGVLFARNGDIVRLIEFLDHHHIPLRTASMGALKVILSSGEPDRNALRDAFLPFLDNQLLPPHILSLVEVCLPILAADLVNANHLTVVTRLLQHSEPRVRLLCIPPFLHAINTQPSTRQNLVHINFMSVLLQLCQSERDDSVLFAADALPMMAFDFTRVDLVETIISLLFPPTVEPIQKAARTSLLSVSKGALPDQRKLLEVHIEKVVQTILDVPFPSEEVVDFSVRLLLNLALAFGESVPHCSFLLDFLSHRQLRIRDASSQAIQVILRTDSIGRRCLRTSVFAQLENAPEPVLELASMAARPLYDDFIQEEDFTALFPLLLHPDLRIRNITTASLIGPIQTSPRARTALSEAGFLSRVLHALEPDRINSDILSWSANTALPPLAKSFSDAGDTVLIIQMLHHQQLSIRAAAVGMLNDIADSSEEKKTKLIESGLFVELLLLLEQPEDLMAGFTVSILPKVIIQITRAGDVNKVVDLLNHSNPQVRNSATSALNTVLQKEPTDRQPLREVLVAKVLGSPTIAECNFASAAFSAFLCDDLCRDEDFPVLFSFLNHSDSRIRAASVVAMTNAMNLSDSFRQNMCTAGFMGKLIPLLENPSPELLEFASTQALPILALTISRRGAARGLMRLLGHRRPEVGAGACAALKIVAKESDVDRSQLVSSGLMSELQPFLRQANETVIDFCVTAFPVLGTFVAEQGEIEKLLDLLSHPDDRVSSASVGALRAIMTSTRALQIVLVRAMIPRLSPIDGAEIIFLCETIDVLGAVFLDIGEGRSLLSLLWSHQDSIAAQANAVIRRLATKGSDQNKKELVLSGLILIYAQLLSDDEYHDVVASLAIYTVPYLAIYTLQNGECNVLVSLFRFDHGDMTKALDMSLRDLANNTSNLRDLVNAELISELLKSIQTQPDAVVVELISFLCSKLTDASVETDRFKVIVDMLIHPEASLREASAIAIKKVASGPETSKETLISTAGFLQRIRDSLEAIHTLELCSTVAFLAFQSVSRSNQLLESGISMPLLRLAEPSMHEDTQMAALRAIEALTSNLADATPLIRSNLLKVLADIIESPLSELETVRMALQITHNVSNAQIQRLAITSSTLRMCMIKCLAHEDTVILISALRVCSNLALETDVEVKSLIQEGVLIPLVGLIEHHLAQVVILACDVTKHLARSGTYRQAIIDSGARKALKNLNSITHRSKMASTENKKGARAAADAALQVLGTRFDEILGKKPSSKGKNKGSMASLTPTSPIPSLKHMISASEGVRDDYSTVLLSPTSSTGRNGSDLPLSPPPIGHRRLQSL